MIYFNSDYLEGAHPALMAKLNETNMVQTVGYGEDEYCAAARVKIQNACQAPEADVHFLVGGTQTNTTVIAAVLRPWQGVLCAVSGHINCHEAGAIESTGHKVITLPTTNGKITAQQVQEYVEWHRNDESTEHIVQPGMVYISNPTEVGTLYNKEELTDISAACYELGLYLFVDGARMAYGLTSPANDLSLQDYAALCDVFYLGGTKCGALFGEAVVITNDDLKPDFRYCLKQHGGMLAKGRLLGEQFLALLDGEDGSAADVGDIVIYNKYVTRTVAVDSSADGAADGLDDLFSTDAEGENGAELEESGAAALDTAPAAEDMTTLDTPDLPDIPDTAAPSVGFPAAEPQTTTVTDTQPVETVGIVSSVDSDADTLTVISGDVDGKVAEVTLFDADVLAVVDVAAAQYADEMLSSAVDGALRAPMMLAAAGLTTPLDDNWITDITVKIDGTQYKVKDNSQFQDLDLTVKDGGSVGLTYNFTIPDNLPEGTTTLTYKLPDGFKLSEDGTADLEDKDGNIIGTLSITKNGDVALDFNSDLHGHQTSGHFFVECKVDSDKVQTNEGITFPGGGTTIKIEKKTNLDLSKEGTITGRTEDGKYKLHYVVQAISKYGSGKAIDLSDYMKLTENSSFANTATYEKITITKKDRKTDTVLKELKENVDFKVTKVTSSGLTDKGIADGNPGIKITDMKGNGLPALEENQRYVLEYDVVVDHIGPDGADLYNCALANDEKSGYRIYFQDELNKSGSYDPEKNEITWTVTITPNGVSMNGYVLKDTLPSGCTMTGYFKVDGQYETNDFPDKGKGSFSYTFSGEQYKKPAHSYTVTYKTTAPANFQIGDKVKNNAYLELNGNKKWEASGDAAYNDRGQTTEKKATADTKLTEDKANNKVFTLPWSLKVIPPIVWGEKDGVKDNRLEIKDCINDPWVSSGKNENNDHYAILKDLQAEIIKNLVVTLKDGTKIYYDQLTSKGLRLEVRYYTGRNVDTSTKVYTLKTVDTTTKIVPANLEQSKIKSFKLVFHKDGFDNSNPVESVEITKYTTLGDSTGLGEGQTIYFKNESSGSSGQYEYTIPGTPSPMQLIKMSADKPPESATSEGYYKTENVKVTSGNGEDGKTYIYYQLKLVTNQASLNLPATITDQLPDHVKYVAGSAKLVAQYYGNQWNNYYYEFVSYTATGGSHKGWNNDVSLSDDRFFANKYDSTKNTLTFNLLDELNYVADKYTSFYIRFAVEVDDTIWDSNLESETKTFTNSAEWTGVGKSETKTDVEHHSTLATKSGHYNQNSNTVDYSVVINPDRKMIGHAEKITLTDTLVVKDGKKNTAALVQSSVKLYSYDAQTKTKGALIPNGAYDVDYKETTNAGGDQNWYILTVKVPNGHSYLLEYKYKNTSNTEYEMKNTAQLETYVVKEVDTKVEKQTMGGSANTVGLTIHKVDSQNISTSLYGAEFKLEMFNAKTGEYETLHEVIVANRNDGSSFYLSFSDSGSTSTGDGTVLRPFNTLYRLTETKAPEGYTVDSTPHYFIWTTDLASKDTAYNTAVGTYAAKTDVEKSNINFYYKGESITLTVKNASNRLVIQKLWEDKYGNAIDGADAKLPPNITVELYKRPGTTGEGEHVTTLTLTKENGWKETYAVPVGDSNYYFYVKETSTGQTYDVSYSNNNVKGTGTIVVTNKEKDNTGYELPSTGGTGTLPYTAVGGTMMLSALAYSFIHRKRRHEGRADD